MARGECSFPAVLAIGENTGTLHSPAKECFNRRPPCRGFLFSSLLSVQLRLLTNDLISRCQTRPITLLKASRSQRSALELLRRQTTVARPPSHSNLPSRVLLLN